VVTGGSFVGSTRDITNDAFMAGGVLDFQGNSPAGIINLGSIISGEGDVVLIGRFARNDGEINAANGVAALSAGDDVLLHPATGDQRIFVKSGMGDVTNTGVIAGAQAELRAGGNVYALAGNTGGLIRATGTTVKDGQVWLTAGNDVTMNGTVLAQNA